MPISHLKPTNMKYLILGFFLSISTITFGQELDCKKFKNGKFILPDSEFGNSIIKRRGSTQIEYHERTQKKMKLKVTWIDDCTYTLKIKNPKNAPTNKGIGNMTLFVEILEIKEDSYIQRSYIEGLDFELISEIYILKKDKRTYLPNSSRSHKTSIELL